MKANIKNEKENPLLSRKEVVVEIESLSTPKRVEAQTHIATMMKVTPEQVVVKKVLNAFGQRVATVHANIYKSAEDKDRIESKVYLNKGKPREAKPAEKK